MKLVEEQERVAKLCQSIKNNSATYRDIVRKITGIDLKSDAECVKRR